MVERELTWCPASDLVKVHILAKRLAAGVDPQDLDATLDVRAVDGDLPVESSRPQQGTVEHLQGRTSQSGTVSVRNWTTS